MRPNFSIVTSFYGEGEDYVLRLYNDISKQKVDWEWIVTDDFSQDPGTEEALRQISDKDKRVKYINQNHKMEIFRDPQKYAKGDFVFHIDADDRVHSNYLSHCLLWFDKFPHVQCILSGSEWVDENQRFKRFTFHIREDLDKKHDFLGRVWRNGFNFKFDEIFSDSNSLIRMNDMFHVKCFETEGDILCLPRIYIRYEMRATSNSSKKRSPDEVRKIKNCHKEFFDWLDKNKKEFPYESYFFEHQMEFMILFPLSWDHQITRVNIVGNTFIPELKRKFRELYPDIQLIFENDGMSGNDCDYKIIDCRKYFSDHNLGKKFNVIILDRHDKKAWDVYSEKLYVEGKVFRWIELWDYKWLITL